MTVGDRIMIRPQTFGAGVDRPGENAKHTALILRPKAPVMWPGTVTYIHPSGRWYQVTFDNGLKECFFIDAEPTPMIPERAIHNRKRVKV